MGAFDEIAHLPRCRDADRVRENDFGGGKPLRQLHDHAGIDTTFERTAERDADRQRHRQLGTLDDAPAAAAASSTD